MKKFSVKKIMPIVSVIVSALIYNVIRNASGTMTVSVQSKSLAAIDTGLYKLVTDNETDADPLPSDQDEFAEFLEVSFESGVTHEGNDVWGTKLVYHHPVRSYYAVGSAGPDKQFGTDDDIYLGRSGESRGMTHDLQKIMKQIETVVAQEKKDNAFATATKAAIETLTQTTEQPASPENVEDSAPDTLSLKQAVMVFDGDKDVKRLVTDLLASSASQDGDVSVIALLGVGSTNSGPAETQPPARRAHIKMTLERLNAEIASYNQFQQTFERLLKQSDYETLRPRLTVAAARMDDGLVGTYVKGLAQDMDAVDGMLDRFLQSIQKKKGNSIVFGAKRGKVKDVVDTMIVLDAGDKESIIDRKDLQPRWILDNSALGELAARDDLYGLGVMLMHRDRHTEAEGLFQKLGEWHPGRERQASWKKIRKEAEASQNLEEIKLAIESGASSRAMTMLAKAKNQYANTDILRLSEDQIAQWEKSATQSIGAKNKKIEEALQKVATVDEGIRTKLNTWHKDRTDKVEALYEQEMGDKEEQLTQMKLAKKKGSKEVTSTQITKLQREIRKVRQRRVDRMSELTTRTRNLQRDHRNAYLRLRRKIGEGEEFTDQQIMSRLDVLAEPDQTADIERRLKPSLILQTRHYVIEYNCTREQVVALGVRLDAFYVSLSKMLSRSEKIRDKVKSHDNKKLTVRCLKDHEAFQAYGKEHCSNFSEGWAAYFKYSAKGAEMVLFPKEENYSSAYHEAFHQFMHRTIPGIGAIPQWFNEGLATYYGTGDFKQGKFSLPKDLDKGRTSILPKAIKDGTFISLESFLQVKLSDWNNENQALHYAEGYTLVHFMLNYPDKRVAKVFRVFIEELAESGKYDEALETAFIQLNRGTLEMLWKDWIMEAAGDDKKEQK
jgi:hypothetical protein